jgi:hypothetical protein
MGNLFRVLLWWAANQLFEIPGELSPWQKAWVQDPQPAACKDE